MIRAALRWLRFLRDLYAPRAPQPLLGRFDADVDRYLQRRAAQAAHHHPIAPRRRARPLNQEGFQ